MRAYVCDTCGKVVLCADNDVFGEVAGICTLRYGKVRRDVDLCEECVEELLKAVRNVKGENNG